LMDDRGSMVRLPMDAPAELPPSNGPWRLLAVDFSFRTGVNPALYSMTVTGIVADGQEIALPTEEWQLQTAASATFEDPVALGVDLPAAGAQPTGIGADIPAIQAGPTLNGRLMPVP